MANKRPFGSSEKTTKKDTATRESASVAPDEKVGAPSKVNEAVWEQAEIAWRNQSGGRGVSTEEGKRAQIQVFYDQMVESDKQAKAWEGKE